jgi:transcriptional regulator GlxA family with amidase domain
VIDASGTRGDRVAFEQRIVTTRTVGTVRGGHATIRWMAGSPVSKHDLKGLVLLRRVRDRIDREFAQPLNVEALARDVHMSAGHLSRQFRMAYGESPYSYLMTRRVERAGAIASLPGNATCDAVRHEPI